jgi:hypothetical protein
MAKILVLVLIWFVIMVSLTGLMIWGNVPPGVRFAVNMLAGGFLGYQASAYYQAGRWG